STTSFLNSGVYRLFGIPFGIKITPPVRHYIILSNKWGAVPGHGASFIYALREIICALSYIRDFSR
ncbi:hypothetical protein, partial [Hominenteromicrobium sp.]|uniref:hypothetical protein n=1 Tax=Hominenteromicrobium sp. TaxID=3073581 RepID=UPI003AB82E47